jgi:hypothetical protein
MLAHRIVSAESIMNLVSDLPREERRIAARRSFQIVEHRIRFLELERSDSPDSPSKDVGKERDDDGL